MWRYERLTLSGRDAETMSMRLYKFNLSRASPRIEALSAMKDTRSGSMQIWQRLVSLQIQPNILSGRRSATMVLGASHYMRNYVICTQYSIPQKHAWDQLQIVFEAGRTRVACLQQAIKLLRLLKDRGAYRLPRQVSQLGTSNQAPAFLRVQ